MVIFKRSRYFQIRIALYQAEVPLLVRDPSAVLIQLVLTMPSTLARGNFFKANN